MKTIRPNIKRESHARQRAGQRHNPGLVAEWDWRGKRYTLELPHGTGDDGYFWQDGNSVYALCINHRLGYCGLTIYQLGDTPYMFGDYAAPANRREADGSGELFLQDEADIREVLGPKGLDYSPVNILKKLLPYAEQ